MFMTYDCPLCGGKQYENDYGIWCLNDPCPNGSRHPDEKSIKFGWKTNPDYMKKYQDRFIKAWEEMGKDYLKWLAKFNGEILLTTEECIEQLKLYAESNLDLDNEQRSLGFRKAAEFLEKYHEDCWR